MPNRTLRLHQRFLQIRDWWLVAHHWEVLPMMSHQFFVARLTQGQPAGRAGLDREGKLGSNETGPDE